MKSALDLPRWKPVLYEGRWHVYRKIADDNYERSDEAFRNRSTALVIAETLNGVEEKRWQKALKVTRDR